jgi:hypothetical protein
MLTSIFFVMVVVVLTWRISSVGIVAKTFRSISFVLLLAMLMGPMLPAMGGLEKAQQTPTPTGSDDNDKTSQEKKNTSGLYHV